MLEGLSKPLKALSPLCVVINECDADDDLLIAWMLPATIVDCLPRTLPPAYFFTISDYTPKSLGAVQKFDAYLLQLSPA